MSKKITVTYEIPAPNELWKYDRARRVTSGEAYFNGEKWLVWEVYGESNGIYPVAVRKHQWRPATEADVGRTDARFFETKHHVSYSGKLVHVGSGNFVAIVDGNRDFASNWKYCEVPTETAK